MDRPARAQRSGHSERRIKLLLTGLDYFVRQLLDIAFAPNTWVVRTLASTQVAPRWRRLAKILSELVQADVWYQIGGGTGHGRILWVTATLRIPVVIHWVGSDVLMARSCFSERPEDIVRWRRAVHWAGAPWLVEELKEVGIEASFVPLPLSSVAAILGRPAPPLPPRFAIATYIPDGRPEFYGWHHILRLANDFPDVTILVVGGTGRAFNFRPPNVRFLGWVEDIASVFSQSTVVVRMTEHDGYGGTVQEALALGRYAIWTYPFPAPGAFLATDYEMLSERVRELYSLYAQGALQLNSAGREYMKTHMHPQVLATRLTTALYQIALGHGG